MSDLATVVPLINTATSWSNISVGAVMRLPKLWIIRSDRRPSCAFDQTLHLTEIRTQVPI